MALLEVACAVEADYVPHAAAMLHAALTSSPGHRVRAHVLHGPAFEIRDARRLRAMADALQGEVVFHEIADERVAGLPDAGYFTAAMWYRIFLPELLPASRRVLYVDVDTLALDDLSPLWDVDLTGRLLGAVTNVFEPFRRERPAELGLSGPEAYFNSGVLLLHLDELRREHASERVRAFAVEHGPDLLWPDQDALNVVLGEGRVPLAPRYNAMNAVLGFPEAESVFGADAVREARERPAIRHFEGPGANKPWHADCRAPHRERYFEHRRATPWPRGRLEGVPRHALLTRARQCLMPMRPV
ncbi:MAG: LPS:glycosyltransferase [Solirubrobacteraceae bacterium]|nr:LPS:glycosyltransferase [Solirubrobacteraceae bacterium]